MVYIADVEAQGVSGLVVIAHQHINSAAVRPDTHSPYPTLHDYFVPERIYAPGIRVRFFEMHIPDGVACPVMDINPLVCPLGKRHVGGANEAGEKCCGEQLLEMLESHGLLLCSDVELVHKENTTHQVICQSVARDSGVYGNDLSLRTP
jgi:hypothetical protein